MALGDNLTTSSTVPNLVLNVTQPVLSTDGTVTQSVTTVVTQPEVIINISDTGILTAVPSGQVVATVEGVYASSPTPTLGFFERVLDELLTSTQNVFRVEKVLLDATQLSEQVKLVLAFIRNYSDVTTLSETISLATGKTYSDLVNAQAGDQLLKTLGRPAEDSTLTSDTKRFDIRQGLLQPVQISVEYKTAIQKLLADRTNSVTDQFATVSNYFKNFAELIDATDDYYGLANIDDDQYAQFIKSVTDGVQFSESSIPKYTLGRPIFDSVINTDKFYNSYSKIFSPDTVRVKDFTGGQNIVAGNFIPGNSYIISSTGTTDFTQIGAANNNPGTQFTATGTGSGTGTAAPAVEIVQVPVNSGSFIPGKTYTITSTGTTDFTQIGAANNNLGTQFIATGSGTGTGVATQGVPSIVTNTTAGNFVPGQTYIIGSTGTTDYTQIGASSNTPGTQFTATGVGSGTGVAYQYTPTPVIENVTTIVTAGNFVPGKVYTITNTGTTDFTLIGAPNNNLGTQFIATGVGTGTGTASSTTPSLITTVTAGNFVPGQTYVIASIGSTNYTLIGASSNTIGVQFTATGTGSGTGSAYQTSTVTSIISIGTKYALSDLLTINDTNKFYSLVNSVTVEKIKIQEVVPKDTAKPLFTVFTNNELLKNTARLVKTNNANFQETAAFLLANTIRGIEYARVYDDYYFNSLGKNSIELLQTSQVFTRAVAKLLIDATTTTDFAYKIFSPGLFSDQITTVDYILVARGINLLDQFAVNDTSKLTPGKVVADTITSQDILSRIADFNLLLSDFIDATDDYYGLANIDDDQYATFNKSVTDNASTIERFIAANARLLADNFIVSDSTQLTPKLSFLESIQLSEQIISRQIAKLLEDAIAESDTITNSISKNLADAVTIFSSDTRILSTQFSLADNFQISEVFKQQFNKLAQDTVTRLDSIQNFVYGKGILDTIGSSESILNKALSKSIRDTLTTTDVTVTNYIVAGPSKNLTDALTTTSSVTINAHNYFASNYASSGYVGTLTYST